MKKRRFSTTEKVLLIVLIVLMAAVVTVGAVIIIGNVNRANFEAENPTIATVSTDEDFTFATDESTKSDDKPEVTSSSKENEQEQMATGTTTKSDTKTEKNTTTTEPTSTEKATKPKKTNNSSATTDNGISVVEPTTNANHNSTEVCKINGTKCYVGDTITVALNLKTPKVLVNFQGYTEYDSSYLKFVSAKANVNGLVNDHNSAIYYNGSDISRGFDFTNTGTLYTATFKIKKAGSTTVKNIMQVLTDMNDTPVKERDCKISVEVYG
ncbi:MAG: cohesin domain-containing protein [Ruminococcus sp.]